MMGPIFYVYEHWRPDNDVVFYVGKGRDRRAYWMSNRNNHHKRIQAKLKAAGLKLEIRFIATALTEEAAYELEKSRIKELRAKGIILTNRTDGGEGAVGYVQSLETRKKIGDASRGKPRPQWLKEHLRIVHTGRVISPESREKISKARANLSAEVRAKYAAAQRGRRYSQETRNKISLAGIGRKQSEESKARRSVANKRQKWTPEQAARFYEAMKKPKSEETKAKIKAARAKQVFSPETRAKMSAAAKGRKCSPQHIQKMVLSRVLNRLFADLRSSREVQYGLRL